MSTCIPFLKKKTNEEKTIFILEKSYLISITNCMPITKMIKYNDLSFTSFN